MSAERIHITGASGSGTSTLGRALAEALACAWLDTDDFFWLPTNPPYREKREVNDRVHLLGSELRKFHRWVISGSLCGWGNVFMPLFDLVVFLDTASSIRIARLRERESSRYGFRIEPGGDMHEQSKEFIAWASAYDTGERVAWSRPVHEDWLRRLPSTCSVLRLDGSEPVEELVQRVLTSLLGRITRSPATERRRGS